jgi:competence protein ComEC
VRSLLILAGVLAALLMPADLPWLIAVAFAVPVFACLVFVQGRILLFALLAFAYARVSAQQILQGRATCDERLLVSAVIDSIPHHEARGWSFVATLDFPRDPQRQPIRSTVSLRGKSQDIPHAGETWQLLLQFHAPRPSQQSAVDRERNLLRDHLQAEAHTIESPLNIRTRAAPASLLRLRESVANRIAERVADPSAAALLAALAVGATGAVSANQWRVFNATGITHLIAISGMHVTFFAMMSMALLRWLWGRVSWLAVMRRERFAAVAGILLAAAYALLSGFSVPAQRTMVMLAAWLIAREFARAVTPMWSVCVALVAVLAYDPVSVLSAGFWLSFSAVVAIILIPGGRIKPGPALAKAADVQIAVSVALVPVTVLIFGTFSFVGLFVNVAAIPLFTFALVPPILLATLAYLLPGDFLHYGGDKLIDVAAWVATQGWPWLAHSADLPHALWRASSSPLWYLLVLPALAFLLLPWRPVTRVIALLALFSVFALPAPAPDPRQLWVALIDTGAPITVLRSRSHAMVFGTGEVFGSRGHRFEQTVLPRLNHLGVRQLDLLVVGKSSRDNTAAITFAQAVVRPRSIWMNADAVVLPPEIGTCRRPGYWSWDGIHFETQAGNEGCSVSISTGEHRLQLSLGAGKQKAPAWSLQSQGKLIVLPDPAEEGTVDLDLAPNRQASVIHANGIRLGIWSGTRSMSCNRRS